MDHKERLRQTARHEVLHGLIALEHSFRVDYVRCAPEGETAVCFPLTPEALPARYGQQPRATTRTVRHIVATALAPAVILGEVIAGNDFNIVR